MDVEKFDRQQLVPRRSPSLVRVHFFLNERSGSGRAAQLRVRFQALADEFGAMAVFHSLSDDEVTRAKLRRIVEAVNATAANEEIRIVVAGGDGSIRSVAEIVAGTDVKFGVVPVGTFNYFARNHGIPLDEEQAFRTILDGATRPVQCGLANERVFLVNASLGSYAQSIFKREKATKALGRNRLVVLFATIWTLISSRRQMRYQIATPDQGIEGFKTPFVFVGNNRLQMENLDPTHKMANGLEEGSLTLITSRASGWWQRIKLVVGSIFTGLSQENLIQHRCAGEFTVFSRKKSSQVALDGEIVELKFPIRVRAMSRVLNLIVPTWN